MRLYVELVELGHVDPVLLAKITVDRVLLGGAQSAVVEYDLGNVAGEVAVARLIAAADVVDAP